MTTDYRNLSDRQLAVACTSRPPDKRAWDALYKRFRSLVDAKIWKMTGLPQSRIEELRQEVFLRVFQNLDASVAERGSLQAYIFRTTASVVIDDWRHNKRELAITAFIEDQPLSLADEAERFNIPVEVIETLSRSQADGFPDPLERQIANLLLNGVRGLQIQEQLQIKPYIVYRVRNELKQRIRSSLEQHKLLRGQDY